MSPNSHTKYDVCLDGSPAISTMEFFWLLFRQRSSLCERRQESGIRSSWLQVGTNIFARLQDSDMAGRGDRYVEITCADSALFKSWPAAELFRMVDAIQEMRNQVATGAVPAVRAHELEQMVGLNFCPHGVLATAVLRPLFNPIASSRYDWVHTLLQDGVFTIEAQCYLTACGEFGVTREAVREFLQHPGWCFPAVSKAKAAQLHRVFDPRRQSENNEDKLKCSASELLGLYGLLRHFVELHVPVVEELAPQRASFNSLCRVLDLLLQIKRCTVPIVQGVRDLRRAVTIHLRLHVEAYGTARVVPKHHWLLDIPGQIAADGMVLDAFVIERQHLTVKGVVEHVRNTTVFERSVLSSVCSLTANQALEVSFGNSLIGSKPAPALGPEAVVGRSMLLFGFSVAVEDVVLRTSCRTAGVVLACCGEGSSLYAVVEKLTAVGQQSQHARAWKLARVQEVWPAEDIEHCLGWYARDDGSWVVLER
jgi:hypothetical protein